MSDEEKQIYWDTVHEILLMFYKCSRPDRMEILEHFASYTKMMVDRARQEAGHETHTN